MACQEGGHNKIWHGSLFDNDTVLTEWGKIDASLQSKTFENAGEKFLEKKIKEKVNKGYVEVE